MVYSLYFYRVKLHEKFMFRCIELAKKGLGTTYPNPLVGSVVVHDEMIIGEGWHEKSGEAHAEVKAIESVRDHSMLSKATLYVNLEPCSHFGKTPPCADLIVSKGIKKIVIGSTDPNPKVSGKGIAKLKAAGCDVTVGVLNSDCEELNKRFFTFYKKKRPYIILKWAQSADGLIAPHIREYIAKPVWISNEDSRQLAHKFRSEEAAILIGTNTAVLDNPALTTRHWHGNSPIRIVLDRNLRIPENARIFDGSVRTIVLSEKKITAKHNLEFKALDFKKPIGIQICELLYNEQLQSLIIEGGSQILQTFIDENLWDEAFVFTGKVWLKSGIKAPLLKDSPISKKWIKTDLLEHYKNPQT